MMMMNRQPSLHKPSIQGHRARVITGQRALRMNYAPCKAYNADFDGDEMNGHLVQSHIAQCEVAELANVGSNFLVPKDATPLLGLIQDHVVSGVLLTIRGRFLSKEDFMHLVLAAFAERTKRIEIPPPTMIKPYRLWSGKQVISCIIKNCVPKDKPLINLTSKSKTPLSCWKVRGFDVPQQNMSESEVVFRQGELLVGVLDKQHYGATQYGLVHSCFELYGHKVGVQILSCFSRLFTTYLQLHGFTLGVADILVRREADKARKQAIKESRTIGDQVVRNAFGLDENVSHNEIKRVLASTYCNPRGQGQDVKMLDYSMKQTISKYNDAITKACVPEGLIRQFPENALQVMIQSGAKGSAVNAMQISCCLGQIELEGKRMAVTVAGRTLPSFKAFDPSPRAGGFIDQRFLTGINPQELFFHTMAGREGLIDTAVKTSRSGYLQRCLIKHLEGLKIHYDGTVRDHDGSVVQEDFMHLVLAAFAERTKRIEIPPPTMIKPYRACVPEGLIRQFPENALQVMIQSGAKGSAVNAMQISCCLGQIELEGKRMAVTVAGRTLPSFKAFDPSPRAGGFIDQRFLTGINPQELFFHTMAGREGLIDTAVKTSRSGYLQRCLIKHLEGLKIHYDGTVRDHDGSVVQFRYGEDGLDVIKASYVNPKTFPFLKDNLDAVIHCSKPDEVRDTEFNVEAAEKQYRKEFNANTTLGALPEKTLDAIYKFSGDNDKLRRSLFWKEPSTQMTLNTFHFAGRGEMNVTLGIPRLREILMTSSEHIATPSAKIKKWRKKSTNSGLGQAKKHYISGFTEFSIDHIGVEKERIVGMWAEMDAAERLVYEKRAPRRCPHSVDEEFNANTTLGALPEKTLDAIYKFSGDNDKLRRSLFWKGMRSLAEPGENVGLLAAQSIGEPSTQMTLNTFHFAGRGEMNVTLGIPRLREILMTSSEHIATPSAKPYCAIASYKVSDCWRRYHLRIEILSSAKREQNAKHLKRKAIMQELERRFLRTLATAINKKYRDVLEYQQVQHRKLRAGNLSAGLGQTDAVTRRAHHMDDGNSSDEEAAGGREADAAEQRLHDRHLDDAAEYEGEEEDRVHVEKDDEDKQTEIQEENEDSEKEPEDDDEMEDEQKESVRQEKKRSADERVKFVISQSNLIVDYKFDVTSERWEVEKFIVHQTPGIERCIESEEMVNDVPTKHLQTQGINLEAFFRHADVLDVNAIYSNDLNLILHQYGVEACSRAIVQDEFGTPGGLGKELNRKN
ncbi:RNA polymerase Rpb1, domain 5 [Ancylostoma ceylanicum]|uniref:DNA-directed RNA polymerase n=1 Tax=Ancylostoma ceylanicum TaxID=53326 RepID=A0A0D6L7B4_9BILA|nr:RNA polymerase Rpb1, domain 5 [Ancylostoma ceylanicum]